MICCVRTGGWGKHNFLIGGAFRKAKYEIRRRRKNRNRKARAGKNSFPPNPLPFCPPERSVSAALRAAISQDFVQKRFELRSVIATNQDISNFQGKELNLVGDEGVEPSTSRSRTERSTAEPVPAIYPTIRRSALLC